MRRGNESEDGLLSRFLNSKNDVIKAFEFLKADLAWREKMDVIKYHRMTAHQLLVDNGSLAAKAMLDRMLPVAYLGRDRFSRPVMYRIFGECLDAAKLMKETGFTFEKYVEFCT